MRFENLSLLLPKTTRSIQFSFLRNNLTLIAVLRLLRVKWPSKGRLFFLVSYFSQHLDKR